MAASEYDSQKYWEKVRKYDERLLGLSTMDRIEQRLIRMEMLLRYLVDVAEKGGKDGSQ